MKFIVCIAFLLFTASAMVAQTPAKPTEFDINTAERFGNLALACVHKEYPNKLSHTLNGDVDVAPPRKLTPAFYGCYDWHSSVHDTGCSLAWLRVSRTLTLRSLPAKPCDKA